MGRSYCAEANRPSSRHPESDLPAPAKLGELLRTAVAEHPERVALACADASLTYQEFAGAANRLASRLGPVVGERVALVAPNLPALAVGLFAIWRAGAIAVPLSARLRRFELERVFANAEPVAAVSVATHGGYALADQIAALTELTPTLRSRIVVDQLGAIADEWQRPDPATAAAPRPEAGPSSARASGDEPAAILYTSGTTGEPKGALMSHALAAAMAHNLAALLGEDAGAAYGLVVPASHAFGLGCLLCGIAAGATAVMVEATASLDPLLRALRHHDAVVLHGSPALFTRLLRSGAEVPIRAGFTAGSHCPAEVLEALDRGGLRVLNLYGLTEIGAATSCRWDDAPEIRYGTVGRPLAGYEVRVVARSRTNPGDEPSGEIQVRSRHLSGGYLGRPWTADELIDGDWFRTGDLGALDAAGNLTIAGRAKEVVHVGGFNVFPAEVESFLLTHPSISQAAVIGAPHPVLGEALQAFVSPVSDASLEPRDVIRFARAGIAGYKVPYAVQVMDELPLLPSGKPDRRELVRLAQPNEVSG